jgi:hypothetical protein
MSGERGVRPVQHDGRDPAEGRRTGMIVDAHLHCSGDERGADVLRALDEAGVDVAVLLAPFLTPPY